VGLFSSKQSTDLTQDPGLGNDRRRDDRQGGASPAHPGRRSSLFSPRPDSSGKRRSERPFPALPPRRRPTLVSLAAGVAAKGSFMLLLAWALCFNFSEVRGGSMMPGIQDRDRILVDHVSYIFSSVHRGDVVVMRYPMDPSVDYVKRVVGLPGDHVQIFDGYVWVNEVLLDEPYVAAAANDPYAFVDTVVQNNCYFVLGDNRIRSSDSREFGQVPHEYLRGKVRMRLWPPLRAGMIQ
jgi:signal peptidase I